MIDRRRQVGFSLVELMVALVIGLFVLVGVVGVMSNSTKNYSETDASARLQENARFAMTALSYDLRMAGYVGCIGSDLTLADPISGVAGDADAFESDRVTVQYGDPKFGTFELAEIQPVSTAEITVVNSDATSLVEAADIIKPGDTIVIASCGIAELHDVAEVNGNTITLDGSTYDLPIRDVTKVMRFVSYEYTIDNDPDSGVPTLYRAQNDEAPEPLVEGIEYMHVLFGTDTDGDQRVDLYQPPDTLVGSEQVTNVKVGLLVRTVSNDRPGNNGGQYGAQADTTGSYRILDVDVAAPASRVRRQVFANSFVLRNKS